MSSPPLVAMEPAEPITVIVSTPVPPVIAPVTLPPALTDTLFGPLPVSILAMEVFTVKSSRSAPPTRLEKFEKVVVIVPLLT